MRFGFILSGLLLISSFDRANANVMQAIYEVNGDTSQITLRDKRISGSERQFETLKVEGRPKQNQNVFDLLLSNLGFLYLLAPHHPEKIELIGFKFHPKFLKIYREIFQFSHYPIPRLVNDPLIGKEFLNFDPTVFKTSDDLGSTLYSAGKDSLKNAKDLLSSVGPENTLLIHWRGLNDGAAPAEYQTTLQNKDDFGIQHLQIIHLRKSRNRFIHNKERQGMRIIFALGIGAFYAMEFGANKIFTQGFSPHHTPTFKTCAGRECTLLKLNDAFQSLQFPIQGAWPTIDEVNTLREIYSDPKWREALAHTISCFSMPQRRANSYKHWERQTPNLYSFFYKNKDGKCIQCGTCIKCRMDLMARLLEDPDVQKKVPKAEVNYFVQHTLSWIKTRGHQEQYPDYLTPTFYDALRSICQMHLSGLAQSEILGKINRVASKQ